MVAEGAAGIPLVDLSEPLSRDICSNPRLVGLTWGENRPGDACGGRSILTTWQILTNDLDGDPSIRRHQTTAPKQR
jgi:hypothetical protein